MRVGRALEQGMSDLCKCPVTDFLERRHRVKKKPTVKGGHQGQDRVRDQEGMSGPTLQHREKRFTVVLLHLLICLCSKHTEARRSDDLTVECLPPLCERHT